MYTGALDLTKVAAGGAPTAVQECGQILYPLGREVDGEPARRRLHCVSIPAWRMAVICSSDSDAVVSVGSRRPPPEQRWQVIM